MWEFGGWRIDWRRDLRWLAWCGVIAFFVVFLVAEQIQSGVSVGGVLGLLVCAVLLTSVLSALGSLARPRTCPKCSVARALRRDLDESADFEFTRTCVRCGHTAGTGWSTNGERSRR